MQKKIVIALTFLLFLFKAIAQQPEDKDALQQQREQLKEKLQKLKKHLMKPGKPQK